MRSILQEAIRSREFDVTESIIIISEPRSGSTWLMELIYDISSILINWEPLHQKYGVVPSVYKWGDRPYIPTHNHNEEFVNFIRELLTLKRFTNWTLKYCSIEDAVSGKLVLTKCVRASLLLPWITHNFQFKYKPIYILRHPIAVALSQIDTFHSNNETLNSFLIPDWMNNDRFIVHFEFISRLTSFLERKVALWCVNNISTINSMSDRWKIIYYEDLVLNPKTELFNLITEIKLPFDVELLNRLNYRQASSTNFTSSFKTNHILQLEKWKSRISYVDLDKIQCIFDHFGLKVYSAFDVLPIRR